MRKVIFGGASSLDNFIAREDGAMDWLMWSKEVSDIIGDSMKRFDTLLMGRKTYEAAAALSPKSENGERHNPYGHTKTYVFSRTLKPKKNTGIEIISENAVEFVRELKLKEGSDICLMGGGELARPLFDAGLIDEIGFNIHPTLLGSGVPLFYEMKRQIDLELIECKELKNGCVVLSYAVKN